VLLMGGYIFGLSCVRLPTLKRCGVFDKALVDKWLQASYRGLPMLPGYICIAEISLIGLISFCCRGKRFVGWTNPTKQATLEGFGYFSNIKEVFPKADMKLVAFLLLTFV
jgi:hypothetical protein